MDPLCSVEKHIDEMISLFVFVCTLKIHHLSPLDNMMEDMDVDLDKEFLQDLKDLKILITDKDLLDQHKRCVFSTVCE